MLSGKQKMASRPNQALRVVSMSPPGTQCLLNTALHMKVTAHRSSSGRICHSGYNEVDNSAHVLGIAHVTCTHILCNVSQN